MFCVAEVMLFWCEVRRVCTLSLEFLDRGFHVFFVGYVVCVVYGWKAGDLRYKMVFWVF
jgi:hypothetical protein